MSGKIQTVAATLQHLMDDRDEARLERDAALDELEALRALVREYFAAYDSGRESGDGSGVIETAEAALRGAVK